MHRNNNYEREFVARETMTSKNENTLDRDPRCPLQAVHIHIHMLTDYFSKYGFFFSQYGFFFLYNWLVHDDLLFSFLILVCC